MTHLARIRRIKRLIRKAKRQKKRTSGLHKIHFRYQFEVLRGDHG